MVLHERFERHWTPSAKDHYDTNDVLRGDVADLLQLGDRAAACAPLGLFFLLKTLGANVAFKRLFARVCPLMFFETGQLAEPLLANVALVGLLPNVCTPMDFETGQLA